RLYLSRLIVESESVQKDIDSEGIMKLIIDCMTVIMTDQLEKEILNLRARIKEAEKSNEDPGSLILKLSQLQKKRHDIRSQVHEIKLK
ncbi:MAG: hypothetical protein DRP96_09255, partial [Candidatus Neomarinimicrobiota bacterium]